VFEEILEFSWFLFHLVKLNVELVEVEELFVIESVEQLLFQNAVGIYQALL